MQNFKNNSLGSLKSYLTNDGSLTLHSSYFKESFHSREGAKKESEEKYLLAAELERHSSKETIHVLDVCVGLGYNTASLLNKILKTDLKLKWWGLELDPRPLSIAINNMHFRKTWEPKILEIMESLERKGCWEFGQSQGKILWGDARDTVNKLPQVRNFDLIMLDAFSPSKCPQLWTEDFLRSLAKLLKPDGRIITYSSAAAVRGSLKRASLSLMSIKSNKEENLNWSSGTVGIYNFNPNKKKGLEEKLQVLSPMEEEHLETKAAVPYRDPYGTRTKEEIMNIRQIEQMKSQMENTKQWKLRWGILD